MTTDFSRCLPNVVEHFGTEFCPLGGQPALSRGIKSMLSIMPTMGAILETNPPEGPCAAGDTHRLR